MSAKMKIVLFSDDAVLQGFLPRLLTEAGYEVVTAPQSDAEIREALDGENLDFVIMDINMPGMDGIEYSLRVRQWSPVPVLMLSAWGAEENKVRGLDLSADTYLTPPFGVDAVVQAIENARLRNAANANLISYARSGMI